MTLTHFRPDTGDAAAPTHPPTATLGAILAALAAATWLALGIESIVEPDPHDYRNAAFIAPWALTLMTIVALHRLQRDRADRLELYGYRGVVATMIIAGVGHLALFVTGVELGLAAVPLWLVAMVVFGIGTVRAGVVPARVGIMLAISQLMVVAIALALSPLVPLQSNGSFSGAVGHGVTFVVVALALRRLTRVPLDA